MRRECTDEKKRCPASVHVILQICAFYAGIKKVGLSVKSEGITDNVICDSVIIKFENCHMRGYTAMANPRK